jgi:hypothetical protein
MIDIPCQGACRRAVGSVEQQRRDGEHIRLPAYQRIEIAEILSNEQIGAEQHGMRRFAAARG